MAHAPLRPACTLHWAEIVPISTMQGSDEGQNRTRGRMAVRLLGRSDCSALQPLVDLDVGTRGVRDSKPRLSNIRHSDMHARETPTAAQACTPEDLWFESLPKRPLHPMNPANPSRVRHYAMNHVHPSRDRLPTL